MKHTNLSFRAILSGTDLIDISSLTILRQWLYDDYPIYVVAEVAGILETISSVEQYRPELLFLSVGAEGVEIARKLFEFRKETEQPIPAVVFMGFEPLPVLNIFESIGSAYLTFPFEKSQFIRVMERLLTLNQLELILADKFQGLKESLVRIKARTEKAHVAISCSDIYYVQATSNHTKIYFRDDGKAISQKPLHELLVILGDNFIQIHRSYIVRVELIQRLEESSAGFEVLLKEIGVKLPVSRRRLSSVRKLFKSI